jgi:hypothetical protein
MSKHQLIGFRKGKVARLMERQDNMPGKDLVSVALKLKPFRVHLLVVADQRTGKLKVELLNCLSGSERRTRWPNYS